jgi:hypothetical protein
VVVSYPEEQQLHVAIPMAPAQAAAGPEAGQQVAILKISVQRRTQGGMHVILETAQSEPPYLLANGTDVPLHYRQASFQVPPGSRCSIPGGCRRGPREQRSCQSAAAEPSIC